MASVLTEIKKLLGVDEEFLHFDTDITLGINTSLATLRQIGADKGEKTVVDKDTTWEQVLGPEYDFEAAKSYIFLKTRLLFDPPSSSAVIESINKMLAELEWRIFVDSDPVTP